MITKGPSEKRSLGKVLSYRGALSVAQWLLLAVVQWWQSPVPPSGSELGGQRALTHRAGEREWEWDRTSLTFQPGETLLLCSYFGALQEVLSVNWMWASVAFSHLYLEENSASKS